MAPPIYFFPKLTAGQLAPQGVLSRSLLAERGMDHALADVEQVPRDASFFELRSAGPGQQSGCMLCATPGGGKTPVRVTYEPEMQDWQQAGPDLWVGLDKEHPPKGEDFQRKQTVQGYVLELADSQWTVPVIRDPEGGSFLPQDYPYDGNGDVTPRIKRQYQQLWDDTADVLACMFEEDGPPAIGTTRTVDLCLAALGINYRVGRIEQNLLGLVDSETAQVILGATVNSPVFFGLYQEVQKKRGMIAPDSEPSTSDADATSAGTSPASTPTSPGSPDETPVTAPADSTTEC